MNTLIRIANHIDYDAVWDIFSKVIQTEDTYVFRKDTPKQELKKRWFADYMHTFVAEKKGEIVGA